LLPGLKLADMLLIKGGRVKEQSKPLEVLNLRASKLISDLKTLNQQGTMLAIRRRQAFLFDV
jgi:hypothetical protein